MTASHTPRPAAPPSPAPSVTESKRENLCERFFWTAQDANYNVLGVVYSTGILAERYEYTPYGKRTVYSRGWLPADLDDDGAVGASDQAILTGVFNTTNPTHRADLDGDGDIDIFESGILAAAYGTSIAAADPKVTYPRAGGTSFRGRSSAGNPTPLCEHGHQGLAHDEEFDLVYNRARMLVPGHGRFGGRDRLTYIDGAHQYKTVSNNPIRYFDPLGLCTMCPDAELHPNVICGRQPPPQATSIGWIICVCKDTPQFKLVYCINDALLDFFPEGSRDGIARCIYAHEETHEDDEGGGCDGNNYWIGLEENKDEDECEGYQAELACLSAELVRCGTSQPCLVGIQLRMHQVATLLVQHCRNP